MDVEGEGGDRSEELSEGRRGAIREVAWEREERNGDEEMEYVFGR